MQNQGVVIYHQYLVHAIQLGGGKRAADG